MRREYTSLIPAQGTRANIDTSRWPRDERDLCAEVSDRAQGAEQFFRIIAQHAAIRRWTRATLAPIAIHFHAKCPLFTIHPCSFLPRFTCHAHRAGYSSRNESDWKVIRPRAVHRPKFPDRSWESTTVRRVEEPLGFHIPRQFQFETEMRHFMTPRCVDFYEDSLHIECFISGRSRRGMFDACPLNFMRIVSFQVPLVFVWLDKDSFY